MAGSDLLCLRGIDKRFPGVLALDDVNFTLREGEIHALLGENGAGKSTLIKVLNGVHAPDGGKITLAGRDIAPRSPHEAEMAGVSTVFQEVNLVPSLSVAENISLGRQPGRWGWIRWRAVRERARAALARLDFECNVDSELGSLSVAHQQLVAIARALDIDAQVLVLDEPTASLDEREVEELFKVMRRLRRQGMGLVFVTHFLDQVYAVSDRLTILRNGRLVGEYIPAELTRLELVGRMLGREMCVTGTASDSLTAFSGGEVVVKATNLGRRGSVGSVNLTLRRGETTGLAGLLGSGRTETGRLLFGIDAADTGTLEVGGRQRLRFTPRQAIRQGLAYCSEDRKVEGIFPQLTVRENLIVALQGRRGMFRRLSSAAQATLCNRYIRALNIKTAHTEVPIRNLSGGNQQKVLLARWLATEPVALILDEPTRGIDVGAKQEIEGLVANLQREGLAVLFISSEIEEVLRTCQCIHVLRERVMRETLVGEEIALPRLMQAMVGTDAHE